MKWGISLLFLLVFAATADASGRIYKWTDETGKIHYDNAVPPDAKDYDVVILNNFGIEIGRIEGKKTEEELAEERRIEAEQEAIRKARQRDQALLNTYLTVEELEDHRERRVELFKAQSRVTELYLRNLERRLRKLQKDAGIDGDGDISESGVDQDLLDAISETETIIARHRGNLEEFKEEEQRIRQRFDDDIQRFMELRGIADDRSGSP